VKIPVPPPLVVLLLLVVGFAVVAQHIPLTDTSDPPSEIILPPETAAPAVLPVTSAVVSSATARGMVEKEISFPYAVPASLVA